MARRAAGRPGRAGLARAACLGLAGALLACDDGPATPRPGANCAPPPAGMIHHWPGDGDGRDAIGSASATVLDGATFTAGLIATGSGQAFLFDGIDASVRVADRASLNPVDGLTLVAWARLDSDAAFTGPVAGKGRHQDEAFVIDHFDGRWRGFIRNDGGLAFIVRSDPFALGRWTHLALTWDGSVVTLYVDGQPVGSRPVSTINATDSFFAIGYRNEEGFSDAELNFEFEGAIDDVAYASRALSAEEIAAIFDAGSDGICRG